MLIPVAHENLRGRRWPYVTIAIIALNFVIFLGTNWRIQDEGQRANVVQFHILLLSAHYPDAAMSPDAMHLVNAFKHEHPGVYAQLGETNRQVADAWDAHQLESNWTSEDAKLK